MAVPTDPDFISEWGVWIGGLIAAVVSGFFARVSIPGLFRGIAFNPFLTSSSRTCA